MKYLGLALLFAVCVWVMFPNREERTRYTTRDWVCLGAMLFVLAAVFILPTAADPDLFRADPR